jgi:polysaccharide deacetylase 2 family uncharacterized protein YibQ
MMAKRRRLKRVRDQRWIGYLLSFLLGSLLTIGGYIYFIQERPLSKEAFVQKVFLIDQIIRSQLYEIGIQKRDVLLQQSSFRKEGDFAWKQSLLKIQLPRSSPLSSIEGNFKQGLSILGRSVSTQSSSGPDSLHLEIRVQNRVTHRLNFAYAKPPTLTTAIRPKIAIVIDDLGGENHLSQEILHWDFPITLSILPFTPYGRTLAEQAHQRGREIILHLPMEPYGYPKIKPGEGALLDEMDEEKIRHQLSKDIEAVPFIRGVSNHMGSRLMENPEKLRIVLVELKRRGLFFLDSRTTPQTVGLQTAKAVGLRATERSLFIDNSPNPEDIKQQLEKLIQLSLSTGKAIGIGHPHPSTLKSLKEMIPKMKEKGIEIVPLSSMMD